MARLVEREVSGEAGAGVAGVVGRVTVVVVAIGRGVLAAERAREARAGRWMGWTSEIGGKGLPEDGLVVGLDLIFLVDFKGSFSEDRLWKRPRKMERLPLEAEA